MIRSVRIDMCALVALIACLLAGCDDKGAVIVDSQRSGYAARNADDSPTAENDGRDSSGSPDAVDPAERGAAEGQAPLNDEDRRFGLLIACTTYDQLSGADLQGPNNDIALMRKLLIDHFGMAENNIQVLAEDTPGKVCRPLKANIAREFRRLAKTVQKDDQVVVFFSGHGGQQPDDDADNKNDPEPDGFDEVLLPADTEADMEPDATAIPNAISDDEFRGWLTALRKKGASVWVILDACHSGTATRSHEVRKEIRPEQLLSPEALAKAKPRNLMRGIQQKSLSTTDLGEEGGLVAIYAAQPHEPTYELPLPDEESGQWQGLLTYTLAKVLLQAERPLTYSELVQRIHAEYITTGRFGPTPLVEGGDRDREVMGTKQWPERTRLILGADHDDNLTLNAGRLHGLTAGSIVAVYPPRGSGDLAASDQPLGYVRIRKARAASSIVEPHEFADTPANDDLPIGAWCDLAQIDFGDLRLKVAIADDNDTLKQVHRKDWAEALATLSEAPNSLVKYVEDPSEADWLIEGAGFGQGTLRPAQALDEPPRFGELPIDETLDDWLRENLCRVARARNLLQIAGATPAEGKKGFLSNLFKAKPLSVLPRLVRLEDVDDETGERVLCSADGLTLQEGELVGLAIKNTGRLQADVTVLFVDSHYGIDVLFPPADTVADNRIPPGESLFVGPMQVQGDSIGLEHLIVIAGRGQGQPLEFGWLAQSSLERARSSGPGEGPASLGSPLGQLFQHAMYAGGNTRGLKMADADDVMLRAISWRTVSAQSDVGTFSP